MVEITKLRHVNKSEFVQFVVNIIPRVFISLKYQDSNHYFHQDNSYLHRIHHHFSPRTATTATSGTATTNTSCTAIYIINNTIYSSSSGKFNIRKRSG